MASYREYSGKITSLRSMRRVTRTMKMVSAGHLRRAQEALARSDQYREALHRMIARLAVAAGKLPDVLRPPHAHAHSALLLVFTSNRGLCGGFNGGVIRAAEEWIDQQGDRWRNLRASFVGRRGHAALKNRVEVRRHYDDIGPRPEFADALRIGLETDAVYRAGKYAEVHVAYARCRSALAFQPVVERLLPVQWPDVQDHIESGDRHLVEPGMDEFAGRLMAQCLHFRIFHALLQSAAAEYGARMMAMDSATTNIDKLTARYTLLRNTARQSAITRELIEIVSGAEALNG